MRNFHMTWLVPLLTGIAAAVSTSTTRSLAAPTATDPTIEVQRALSHLAAFDGVWSGPVERIDPDGKVIKLAMIARVGPMLDGTIRVLEERTGTLDGRPVFHLVAVFSFASTTQEYTIHTYARGRVGSAVLHPTPDGYFFEMPGEDGATMRFTWKVGDGGWRETVERLVAGHPPFAEARIQLKRTGTSDWPNGEFPSIVQK